MQVNRPAGVRPVRDRLGDWAPESAAVADGMADGESSSVQDLRSRGMARRVDGLAASGWRAVAELDRIQMVLERIAGDVPEHHLGERIREAAERIRPVVVALRFELDKSAPDRWWVRSYLAIGGMALAGLGGILVNNVLNGLISSTLRQHSA